MTRVLLLLVCVAAVVACGRELTTNPRGAAVRRGISEFRVTPSPHSPTRFGAPSAFARSGDDHGAPHDPLTAAAGRGLPAVAVGDAGLMGEAVAVMVRDRRSVEPRLVILSARYLNDATMHLAQSLLVRDEIRQPSDVAVRRITLFSNGKLRLDADGATRWAAWKGGVSNSTGTDRVRELHSRADSHGMLRVEGLGEVRLLRPSRRPTGE
jgi:hypothetical protein